MIECPRCASRNHVDDAFCGSCGMYLGWADRPPVAQPVAVAVAVQVETTTGLEPGSEFHPVATAVPDSHGRVCSSCSRINPWERRFCARCGTRLIHGDDIVRPTLSTQMVIAPWWQRIAFWRWPRGERVFPAGTRPGPRRYFTPRPLPALDVDASPPARAAHWVKITVRRIWPDVLLALLLLALVCLLVPSLTRNVYDAVRDRVSPLPVVTPASCTEPASRANLLPAFPATFACDGQNGTAWATPISPKYSAPELIINLTGPTAAGGVPTPGVDVTEFQINASVPPADYAAPASGRPAQLQLDFYADTSSGAHPVRTLLIPGPQGKSQLKIADTSDTQSWSISPCLAGIKVVVVTVRQAYPDPINHAPAGNVFVNSVALLRPRSPCNQT
ncbi:MAG TPA: zinc ribbon domain-containing protein [Sporichthyaceae bacterium]|jgi:hypothetical protein|nr:zinc ribbon domain-containing protein [Sporichthyaceae bacterium]